MAKIQLRWLRKLSGVAACASLALGILIMIAVERGFFGDSWTDASRRWKSRFQSGTQVYFDEGRNADSHYSARVSAFDSGKQILFGKVGAVSGSTLPDDPAQFPTVAEQSIPFRRGIHYGTVTNSVYAAKNTPALILNPGEGSPSARQGRAVATVGPNESPFAGANKGLRQASQVHVHTGLSASNRGSAACLTIAPEHARLFFDSTIGGSGTVHIAVSPSSRAR
jgi:hypothetical protein